MSENGSQERYPEVVAIHEIAAMGGVTRQTAHKYVNRESFPAPIHPDLAVGRLWRTDQVRGWLEEFAEMKRRMEAFNA